MNRTALVSTIVVAAIVTAMAAAWHYGATRPLELTLWFHPFVGADPLVANDLRYANPGGEGQFEVRNFQFYLSNIRLVGATDVHAEPDSYHLVRFDSSERTHAITLHNVPRGGYDRIEFGIGVDPAANGSIETVGDLDPNGRMAWTWDVGYKFVLFEGSLEREGAQQPLVYHVGFDENYRSVSIPLAHDVLDDRTPLLALRVDLLRMFTAHATVDMAKLPTVKFDRDDAALLARNYAEMISPL